MKNTRKLKPCPFCGESKRLQMMYTPAIRAHFIICRNCLLFGPKAFFKGSYYKGKVLSKSVSVSKSWAVRFWNRRVRKDDRRYAVKRTDLTLVEIMKSR